MDKIYSSIKLNFTQRKQNIALLSIGIALLLVGVWLIAIYLNYYQDRFYPKTYLDEINISGLTIDEARNKIQKKLQEKQIDFAQSNLQIYFQEKKVEAKLFDLEIEDKLDSNLASAFAPGHQERFWPKIKFIINGHLQANKYYSTLSYNQEKVKHLLEELKTQVDFAGEKPSATLSNKKVIIHAGLNSNELLIDETWQVLQEQLFTKKVNELNEEDFQIQAVVAHSVLALTQEEINLAQKQVTKFIGKNLTLNYEYQKIQLDDKQLISFLNLPGVVDQEKIQTYINELKTRINRPSSDALFNYNSETLQVIEFIPDQDGLEIDSESTKNILLNFINAILQNEEIIDQENIFTLPMTNSKAKITLADTNNLGIKEVIGFGESWYDHSIPNRIDNVALTTSRINNHIVKPGQEFSFNQTLGEVSDKTGYKNAYIIEAGETKLAPGGGVCQVSSTLFRSLLNAGVKITRRLPHAYRVSYYEIGNEPGFDATVYTGSTDLRFVNDTPGHILISCQADSENLYMFCKLYGTSDGRNTEIVKYKKWGQTPALPTVYIPDTSLRPGQLKQIDWSASGIKAEFTNVIRDKNGETIREDYYYSSYRPWAAKFLQGV